MARTLHTFPSEERSGRYPWGQWLNGEVWELEKDNDYTVTTRSFRSAVQQAAKSKSKKTPGKVRTAIVGMDTEQERLVVQFIPTDAPVEVEKDES